MTEATHTPGLEPEADRELVLERVFDAPRALVFKAWTDPAHLPVWFGPKGFTCTTHAIDVRPGGAWHFDMHGPDGTDYPNFMRFLTIEPNERITYDHGALPDEPAHFQGTVTFADEPGGRTRLRMRNLFPTAEARAAVEGFGAVELGYQTLEKLAERLAATTLTFTRTFDAPRELVYRAWAEPQRFAKWWGPAGMALEVLKQDIRPGGVFHYRMYNDAGAEMWGRFAYVELAAPERLVWVNAFSDPEGNVVPAPFPGMEAFPLEIYNVMTLTEEDGKTLLKLTGGPLAATAKQLDFYLGMNASMQQGFGGTFDKLAAYLAQAA